ncbi:MAG TPA: hypothetical protein VGK97_04075, partial [Spongiibacteraceae bacterium]
MRKSIISILAIAGLLLLALVLNPSAERHRQKITENIGERSQLENVLGVGQLTAFVSRYHSFWIGSYTTVNDKVTS